MSDGIAADETSTEELVSSILNSVKKSLNIYPDETAFDADIIVCINSVFSELNQLGVGPIEGFEITGPDEEWSEYLSDVNMNMVRSYMILEVRLMFDPPTASLLSALEKKRDEYEWRLSVAASTPTYVPEE